MSRRQASPCSQSIPENRRGTRTHAKLLKYASGIDGGHLRVAMQASPKTAAKAARLLDRGISSRSGPGRIVRAVMREWEWGFCMDAESRIG